MKGQFRKGRVTDVDEGAWLVRVVFPDSGMVSGWLSVIRRGDDWLPAIDDTVLCVYDYGSNADDCSVDADGFVLGVVS